MSNGIVEYGARLVEAAERYYTPGQRRRRVARRAARVVAPPLAVAATVAGAVALVPSGGEAPAPPTAVPAAGLVGEPAPAPPMKPLFGKYFDRPPTYQGGGATLVVFGASWCRPCVDDLPALGEADATLAAEGGGVEYIVSRDNAAAARRMPFPESLRDEVGIDPEGLFARRWGYRTFPAIALVAPDGTVAAQRPGPLDERWLEMNLERAMAPARAEMQRAVEAFAALRDRSNIVETPPELSTFFGDVSGETHLVLENVQRRVWVTIAPGQQCFTYLNRRGGGGGGCGEISERFFVESGISYTAGGLVQGFMPDGTSDIRAHMKDGRVVVLSLRNNVLSAKFDVLPERVTWIDPSGKRQSTNTKF
ncbi:MAG: hypothetical protein WKF94_02335 [Solirubrobacteraceae bacterium]